MVTENNNGLIFAKYILQDQGIKKQQAFVKSKD